MLDLQRLHRIELVPRPRSHRILGRWVVGPLFDLRGVRVRVEHAERVPREPVIFAMNHTDRFNYLPLQLWLLREQGRFTAVWVKGKYYEHPLIAAFMEHTNQLPTVSRGYLVSRDFLSLHGRAPTEAEYEALRALVDGRADEGTVRSVVPTGTLDRPRNMLGRPFEPGAESYAEAVRALFAAMMRRFVELNRRVFEVGLDLLVFPQGTRSIRLSRGHPGLAHVALDVRRPVVPVGMSGSDRIFPGNSPVPRPGEVVVRFGEPIRYEDVPDLHLPPFEPFSVRAEQAHGAVFQTFVDRIMDRIDALLDPPYRYADDRASDGVRGTARFL
ncbi:MAG: 1-acyl-sn-glycerol-3-phosphate acyltransferase [Myxococcota bacterium]|nr:1-acyl-sn-glycerol-3-phosphate acyltransferase [Myxococcota bacterium]MDW8362181.1 lysophospholipid acyltransferase family protein [Myxococcales bacterium]